MQTHLDTGITAISDADFSDDPLIALEQLARARGFLDYRTERTVDDARKAGKAWQEIGDALGITRQGARKRYLPILDTFD